jgi:hypothetical protein
MSTPRSPSTGDNLGFTEVMHPAPAFAMLTLRNLRLVELFGPTMPEARLARPS